MLPFGWTCQPNAVFHIHRRSIRNDQSPWRRTHGRAVSDFEQTRARCSESEDQVAGRKIDRRVERTRALLRKALLSLVEERGFEGLTVQDIIDRANVGRATFYAHFDNKEDLLVSGLEELRLSLKEQLHTALAQRSGSDDRLFTFSRGLFEHASGHRDLFRAMAGKRSRAVVQRLFQRMLLELVRENLKAMAPAADRGSLRLEAAIQFIAGGLFGLQMWWMDGKVLLSADEIDEIFRRLAIPALKAGLG